MTSEEIAAVIAQALADGHTGCSGGCEHRPCVVDEQSAAAIADRLEDAGVNKGQIY